MKFSIKNFFSKFDQTRSFLRIWSHLLKKSLMKNFIFCAVMVQWSEAAIRRCTIKQFCRVLKISQKKKLVHEPLLNKLAGLRPEILLRKRLLERFPVSFAKNSRAPFCKIRPGECFSKISFLLVTSTSASKCYHWPCFFRSTLHVLEETFLFSESPRQLSMTELINC